MDRLIRAIFALPDETDAVNEGEPTRGRLVSCDVTALAQEIVSRHECAPGPALALSQVTVGTTLLSSMLKGEERISVQVVCSGPLGRLMVESTGEGTLRGFPRDALASAGGSSPESQARAALGTTGEVHVMRSLDGHILYQGSSPLLRLGLEASFEAYLHQSEQIASAVVMDVRLNAEGRVERARGVLVQALGGGDAGRFASFLEGLDRRALRARLQADDLDGMSAALKDIHGVELAETRLLSFACLCSRGRAASSLLALGAADLTALREERGGEVEVDCAFCRSFYRFSGIELDAIIEIAQPATPTAQA